jgi:hypothetical protein
MEYSDRTVTIENDRGATIVVAFRLRSDMELFQNFMQGAYHPRIKQVTLDDPLLLPGEVDTLK